MKFSANEIPVEAKRFKASLLRIVILALAVCSIYGGGIFAAVWAGYRTIEAAHAGGDIPFFAWSCAFFLIISGMLSVVYGFFFRPREVRLTDSLVAMVWWHGDGVGMRRDRLESAEAKGGKIVLRGGGETVTIPAIFSGRKELAEELKTWVRK